MWDSHSVTLARIRSESLPEKIAQESVCRGRRAGQNPRHGTEAMEVAEVNLVQLEAALVTPPQKDLSSNREKVLLTANSDVVVVCADERLVDGIVLRHVVCDLCDSPDLASGAVDVDHAVIANVHHLLGTGAQREVRIVFGHAVFEDLHGSVAELIGFKPGDIRFCRWPEESANAIAEDAETGKATSRIDAAV